LREVGLQHVELGALFDRPSHNPSIFELRAAAGTGDILDFCVPVNTWFPPEALTRAVAANLETILTYYPDNALRHQQALEELTGLPADCIVPANGSTEIITQVCQQLACPVVTPVPTFGRWTDLPLERGLPTRFLERRREQSFRFTVDELVAAAGLETLPALIVCNPDNPTGVALSLDDVTELAQRLTHLPLIVIDESFIDFADVRSAAELSTCWPNLVVIKSMGKSLGWHGLRLGYAVANPLRAADLRKSLPFWNVNGLASFVLKQLPRYKTEQLASFEAVKRDRGYMHSRLDCIPGLQVHPSQANFLLCELDAGIDGRELRTQLLDQHRILIRECGNKLGGTSSQLRLAVHRREAVDRLAGALESLIAYPA
jgi:threonine-phosphate decarboxylase